MSPTWMESKRRRRQVWVVTALAALIAAIGFLVYRNNTDSAIDNSEAEEQVTPPAPVIVAAESIASSIPDSPGHANSPAPIDDLPPPVGQVVPPADAVHLSGIVCALANRPDVRVSVSLDVYGVSEQAHEELMRKREVLKTVVQSVFAKKRLDEIVVDALGRDVALALSGQLESGAIDSVKFREIRIDDNRQTDISGM